MHEDTMAFHPAANQFLSFRLGGLEYGVDFGKVQELRIIRSLERFAADGAIVEGVAVSRGVIMPIVDMRAAFCGHPVVTTPTTDVEGRDATWTPASSSRWRTRSATGASPWPATSTAPGTSEPPSWWRRSRDGRPA